MPHILQVGNRIVDGDETGTVTNIVRDDETGEPCAAVVMLDEPDEEGRRWGTLDLTKVDLFPVTYQ